MLLALSVSAQDVSAEFVQKCYSSNQFALWDTLRNDWFFGWGGPWTCASGYVCSNGRCTNPCAGISCPDKCEGNFRQFGGACAEGNCWYTSQYCQFGCVNGACNPDPCAGISCNSPPAPYCSGNDVISYNSPGTCSGGSCSYTRISTTCPPTSTTYSANYCSNGNVFRNKIDTISFCSQYSNSCRSYEQNTPELVQTCQYGCSNGACNACSSGYGSSCTSPANACGQTSAGTIKCDGTCSATTPANPANYGSSCTASNACGTNYGTVTCAGSCSVGPPSVQEGWRCKDSSTRAYQNADCSWGSIQACQYGCSNGDCNPDPCAGVTCNSPPASYCSGNTLISYNSPGTCSGGSCSYSTSSKTCRSGTEYGGWGSNFCSGSNVYHSRTITDHPGCNNGQCGSPSTWTDTQLVQVCGGWGCSNGACNPPPSCAAGWKCVSWSNIDYQYSDCSWWLGGSGTGCGSAAVSCNAYCGGSGSKQLCKYPAQTAYCQNQCSGDSCVSCAPSCGTPSCSYVEGQCGYTACKEEAFSVSQVTPYSQSSYPSHSKTYSFVVTNNDNSYCSPKNYMIGVSVPKDFAHSLSATSLLLKPGSSGTVTVSVQSPSLASGTYYLSAGVSDGKATEVRYFVLVVTPPKWSAEGQAPGTCAGGSCYSEKCDFDTGACARTDISCPYGCNPSSGACYPCFGDMIC